MTRKQITLYGDDAEWFEELQSDVADDRNGNEPSNAELTRLMMQRFKSQSQRL